MHKGASHKHFPFCAFSNVPSLETMIERRFPQQSSGNKVYPGTNLYTNWNGSDIFPDCKQISIVYSAARGRAKKSEIPSKHAKSRHYRPASETPFPPLSARQRKAIGMAFRWRADSGPRLDAGWVVDRKAKYATPPVYMACIQNKSKPDASCSYFLSTYFLFDVQSEKIALIAHRYSEGTEQSPHHQNHGWIQREGGISLAGR